MRSVAAIGGYYGISYHMSFDEHATRDCRRVSIKIEFIKHVLYFILTGNWSPRLPMDVELKSIRCVWSKIPGLCTSFVPDI